MMQSAPALCDGHGSGCSILRERFLRLASVFLRSQASPSQNAETKKTEKGIEEVLDPEDKSGVKKTQEALDVSKLLPVAEIGGMAEQAAGKGTAVAYKLEKEMGIQIWDVQVQDGVKETEVLINAETGEVLQTKTDS